MTSTRDESSNGPISADCLFFILLLIPHFFRFPELNRTAFPLGVWRWLEPLVPRPTPSLPNPTTLIVASLLMLLLVCYLFAHVWERSAEGPSRGAHRLKLALVLGAFTIIILGPALHEISLRRVLGPQTHAHDGVIQVEEAIKKTLRGRNVYIETFYGTPLEKSGYADPQLWQRLGIETFPALRYFGYLPLTFLIPLPFYLAAMATIGWFDLRFLLIPAYLIFIWLAYRIAKLPRRKIVAVQFVALNPFMATFMITGRNDALPLAMLAAALFLLERRPVWAQVFLALACLTKQYIWLMVPFFGLFLVRSDGEKSFVKSAAAAIARLWPFWLLFTVGMLPYFLWSPSAFVKSIVLHSNAHPIKGIGAYGFGTWVLYFGWVKDAAGRFPFFAVQALFTLPVLLYCFARQRRENTLPQLILGGALVIFVFFYFSRFLHDNYFGVATTLLALAYCAGGAGQGESEVDRRVIA